MACKSTKVIKINGLSKTFTTDAGLPQTAINNLSLTIPGGQIFGILGGAAAGKTTLVKLIAGLQEPSAGTICLKNPVSLILAGLPATVNPNLSINENCLAGMPPESAEAEWLETILRDLHLLKVRDYPICSLGPAAQRLAGFACVLAWSPPIVILDEPLAEFESDVAQLLKYWLVKLVYKYNKTVVIATRDPALVEELCDEVALLSQGRLITQQPVMALLGSTTGARYQIRVQGHLSADWSEWFDNLAITNTENGETVISGIIRDQAALYGVLGRIQNLALALLSITRAELNLADIAAQLTASG